MHTTLDFHIEQSPLDDLIRDIESYTPIRLRLLGAGLDTQCLNERLEKLFITRVNSSIAILYTYYKKGMLERAVELARSPMISDDDGIYRVDFGNSIDRIRYSSKLCRVLADLDVERIGASKPLAEMYHQIRVIVDKLRDKDKDVVYSAEFWRQYFLFYDAYYVDVRENC